MLLTTGITGAAIATDCSRSRSRSAAASSHRVEGRRHRSGSVRLRPSTSDLARALDGGAGAGDHRRLGFVVGAADTGSPVACSAGRSLAHGPRVEPEHRDIAPAPTGTAPASPGAKAHQGHRVGQFQGTQRPARCIRPANGRTAAAAPPSAPTREAGDPAVSITGCVYSVSSSVAAGPWLISAARSRSSAAEARRACRGSRMVAPRSSMRRSASPTGRRMRMRPWECCWRARWARSEIHQQGPT